MSARWSSQMGQARDWPSLLARRHDLHELGLAMCPNSAGNFLALPSSSAGVHIQRGWAAITHLFVSTTQLCRVPSPNPCFSSGHLYCKPVTHATDRLQLQTWCGALHRALRSAAACGLHRAVCEGPACCLLPHGDLMQRLSRRPLGVELWGAAPSPAAAATALACSSRLALLLPCRAAAALHQRTPGWPSTGQPGTTSPRPTVSGACPAGQARAALPCTAAAGRMGRRFVLCCSHLPCSPLLHCCGCSAGHCPNGDCACQAA